MNTDNKKLLKYFGFIFIALLLAYSYLTYSKKNIYLMAIKLKLLHPAATIKNIEPTGVVKPGRFVVVSMGDEKISLFEFNDKESTEKAMWILTDGSPGEDSIVDAKEKIIIKYNGNNEKIIKQIAGLLH